MALDKNGKQLPKGITQRKDGRYQARYTFNSKRYTIYDTNLRELQKRLRTALYEVENGIHAKPEKVTVDVWFGTWMTEYKENTVRKSTFDSYGKLYRTHIKVRIGKKAIRDVRAEHIQSLYNEMVRDGSKKATIGAVRNVLSGMFTQAMKNDIIIKNPVPLATLPRDTEKEERRVMSKEEQDVFTSYFQDSRYKDVFILALATGMRIGEILGLEWKDVDTQKGELKVTGSLNRRNGEGFYRGNPKTANGRRTIPLLPHVVTMLKKRKRGQMEGRLLVGEKWQPQKGLENLVFTDEFGKPIYAKYALVEIDRIVKRINLDGIPFERITPHTLRHTFATRGLERGINPKVMQEILGHANISMTLDLYSHVLPHTKEEEMKKLEGLF